MNTDIKVLALQGGIRLWQVAAELKIAEETLSRWLRHNLSQERRNAIVTAIEKLSKGAK